MTKSDAILKISNDTSRKISIVDLMLGNIQIIKAGETYFPSRNNGTNVTKIEIIRNAQCGTRKCSCKCDNVVIKNLMTTSVLVVDPQLNKDQNIMLSAGATINIPDQIFYNDKKKCAPINLIVLDYSALESETEDPNPISVIPQGFNNSFSIGPLSYIVTGIRVSTDSNGIPISTSIRGTQSTNPNSSLTLLLGPATEISGTLSTKNFTGQVQPPDIGPVPTYTLTQGDLLRGFAWNWTISSSFNVLTGTISGSSIN